MRFKVGDKARVKVDLNGEGHYDGVYFNPDMEKYKNQIVTIKGIICGCYEIEEDGGMWSWNDDMLMPIDFSKNDLQNFDIVTLENGDKLVFINGRFEDESTNFNNYLSCLEELKDDMTMEDRKFRDSDIVKVERPIKYQYVYVRKDKQKMTVSEICDALGYEVEIVKENN